MDYNEQLVRLKRAFEAEALTTAEYTRAKRIATAGMMGVDPSMLATPPDKSSAINGSHDRSTVSERRQVQKELAMRPGSEDSDDSDEGSSEDQEYPDEPNEPPEKTKLSENKKAARGLHAAALLNDSKTSSTRLLVLTTEGKIEERLIGNEYTSRDGKLAKVWDSRGGSEAHLFTCVVCSKKLTGSGGWFDSSQRGFSSQTFKSKMQHNTYRTHTNRLISKLPKTLPDGARPLVWPDGNGVKYDSVKDRPIEDLLAPRWFRLAKMLNQEEAKLLSRDTPALTQQSQAAPPQASQQGARAQPEQGKPKPSQKPRLRPIDHAFLENYFTKKLGLQSSQPTNAEMRAASELIAIKAGERLCATIEDLTELDCYATTQRTRRGDKLTFHQGINHEIVTVVAPQRYGNVVVQQLQFEGGSVPSKCNVKAQWLINMGDGTRGLRAAEAWHGFITGVVYPPDVSLWPKEPGIPVPQSYEDLVTIIRSICGNNCLSHEIDMQVFRCITDTTKPILVHTIWPMPHKGFSGFLHFKMWLHFIIGWHQAGLLVVGFTNDSCSTAISAAHYLCIPNREFITDFQLTCLGLPDLDYKFFAVFLRPRIGLYLPPPFDWYGDIAHHIRNFRKNIDNKLKTIVFYSEQDVSDEGVVEAGFWATMLYLKRLAAERGDLSRKFSLQDMVNINEWFDQRNKAAENLISLRTIEMLEREVPEDCITPMAMRSMYFFSEPWINSTFTDPFKIIEYLWRGLAVWGQQETYVVKCLKSKTRAGGNKKLHCPSYQFVETMRIMAHSGTNHQLKAHLDTEFENGTATLAHINNNPVEQLHSEERCGGNLSQAAWDRRGKHK